MTEAAEFYKVYEEHAKTLRTWLVAYGIGGPVLILGNERVWKLLVTSGSTGAIGLLFLSGVTIQVLLAAVNKTINWTNYYILLHEIPEEEWPWYVRLCDWLSSQFWIDFVADVVSLSFFGVATYLVYARLACAGAA